MILSITRTRTPTITDETYPSAVAPGVADTASPQPSATSPYLTTVEAAVYLRVSKSFLDKARVYGNGPRFVRPGARKVVYHITDLDAWAAERQYASTSEYRGPSCRDDHADE